MTTTITWIIENLWVKPHEGSFDDVVITAAWRANAVSEHEGQTYNATVYGTASFPQPGSPFVPYAELSQEQVLDWCWANGVNRLQIEETLEENIDSQINPPVIQPPLPW